MNKVELIGRAGQDPRITRFNNGGMTAQFSLATTERARTTRDGHEIPEVTDWHEVVVKQSGLAGVCEKYVKRGSLIGLVGKLRTRQYQDSAGQTRYITEVIVEDLELLGSKRESAPAPAPDYTPVDDLPQ